MWVFEQENDKQAKERMVEFIQNQSLLKSEHYYYYWYNKKRIKKDKWSLKSCSW